MIKTLLRYAVYGLAIGCLNMIIFLMILDSFWPDTFFVIMQNFTINILSGLAISTISSVGAITYKFDRLNSGLQIAMHIAIILVVVLPIAFIFGWFSSSSPTTIAIVIAVWGLIFSVIWFCFYQFGNSEVKKINNKIKKCDTKK